MPDFDDDDEYYLARGSGEIQLDTGHATDLDKLIEFFAATHRVREMTSGLRYRITYTSNERQRRQGLPPAPVAPLKPNKTAGNISPQESAPPADDRPELQGAPDIDAPAEAEIVIKARGQSTQPLVSPLEPTLIVFDPLNPFLPEEVADLLESPPDDFDEFVDRLRKNEPEPEEPHPTHSAPAARQTAADGDPVDLCNGVFTLSVTDLVIPTPCIPIAMRRSYRSGRPYFGPFGFGWDHPYNVYLRELKDGRIAWWTGELQEQYFKPDGGGYEPDAGVGARIERTAADAFTIEFAGGTRWLFERPPGWSDTGRIPLTAIQDRHGNAVTLTYGPLDRVISVLDEGGRGLLFSYGSCELLERVTDHTGAREIRYEHDSEIEHLIKVVLPATARYPGGLATKYEYASYDPHPAMRHNIVRIVDADDRLMVENEYAGPGAGWEFNRVVRQRMGGFEYQFGYEQIQYVEPLPENVDALASRTLVRPPDGSLHTYTFNYRGDLLDHRFRLIRDGSYRVVASQWRYDAEGNATEAVGPDGLRTVFTYDSANPDPCARRNLLQVELAAPLPGIVPSRSIFEARYEPRYQLPVKTIDEAGAETKFVYDFDVSPVGSSGRLLETQLPTVVGADGQMQQSVLAFEYNARGQITAAITPEGCRTELEYYAGGVRDGLLSTVKRDPAGTNLIARIDYDSAGYPAFIEEPAGRATNYRYNALGQPEEERAPAIAGGDALQRRWFDDSGEIVRVERPAGSYTGSAGSPIADEVERDELGNTRRIVLASNTAERQEWLQRPDHAGRAEAVWNPSGARMERTYGEDGSLLSETAAAGEKEALKTTYVSDRAGRVTRIVNAWKAETRIEYDVWGRPHRITLATGAVQSLEWGVNDRLLEERLEETVGGATLLRYRQDYEYDQRGRLAASTVFSFRDNPAIAVPLRTTYLYDKDDRLRELQLPRGARFQYAFDGAGRASADVDPFGNVRQYNYDAAGRLATITMIDAVDGGPRSRSVEFGFDARGRLTQTTFLDSTTRFDYDDRDVIVGERLASGVTRRFQLNALGQIVESVVDPAALALRSTFAYDAAGDLIRYVDPTNRATRWDRDILGRTTAIHLPDATTWQYLLDMKTRTTESATPAGNRVIHEVVNPGQLRIATLAGAGQENVAPQEFLFDGVGRLVEAASGADSVRRQYDSLGRVIEESARGQIVRTEYDDVTGSVDLVYPDGRRERTEHNAVGQPTRIVLVTPGALGGFAGDVLLEIFYTSSGLPVRVVYGNGVEEQRIYDDHDRLIRVEYQSGGELLDSCRLRYDENGHRAVVQYLGAPGASAVHQFDGNGRLVEARSVLALAPLTDAGAPASQAADIAAARGAALGSPGAAYLLNDSDARFDRKSLNGGPADVAYTLGTDHRVLAADASAISYNLDGQRVLDAKYGYDLDALNRVKRVRDRATNAVLVEINYDALGRVISQTTPGNASEHWFAGSTRIHEASAAGVTRQFPEHPLLPSAFCVVDATGAAYVHHDEGWSTMCLTGETGEVIERHRCDTFGTSTAFAADGVTPLAELKMEPNWRGMTALRGTSLFQTPQRLYDAALGVFTGRDPLLYSDSPSPYSFAGHNPVDFADPTGLAKAPLGSSEEPPAPGGVRTLQETVITEPIPFEPKVSYGPALEAAEGRGRIERGDVEQFGNGAYNGVINVLPLLMGPMLGPFTARLDIKKAPIDPRYGGAAIIGEHLAENLALEAALALPAAMSLLKKIFTSRRLVCAFKTPVFWALGAGGMGGGSIGRAGARKAAAAIEVKYLGQTPVISDAAWAEYQVSATGSPMEHVFEITQNGATRQVLVDGAELPYLVEAKYGNMGQMFNPQREAHVIKQAQDYLAITEAFGLKGVKYRVSTKLGAQRLRQRFKWEFPAEYRSGKIRVKWVRSR